MTRQFAFLLVSLTSSMVCSADEFQMGSTSIMIPTPEGFVRLSSDMEVPYRYVSSFVSLESDLLAHYLTYSDAEHARNSEPLESGRRMEVQVYKPYRIRKVGADEFSELVSLVKYNNKQMFREIRPEVAEEMQQSSSIISEEFDVDFEMEIGEVIPLDVHYETENAVSYTILGRTTIGVDKNMETSTVATTATFVNLGERVVFLYCSAPKDEIEWTRRASQTWVEAAMSANPAPLVTSVKEARKNRRLESLARGAGKVVGFTLVLGLSFVWFKKRKA